MACHGFGFVMSKDCRQALRFSCHFKRQFPQRLLQELTKKKNDGVQSSSLRAHTVVALYREMRQKLFHLFCGAGGRMLHTMKADEAFDPVTVGLFGFVGQIPAADQCAELIHEAGRFIRQFWWYIQYHALSLHAVFIYSILRLARRNCTVKNGDIRQLSQNSITLGIRSLQPHEKYEIVSEERLEISEQMFLWKSDN